MELKFYDVDSSYTDYLRQFEEKTPYIGGYKNHNKFLCGVILTVNSTNYYVPVSSNKQKFRSSFMIYGKDRDNNDIVTSSLRFSFMFPCPMESITLKDLKKEKDAYYKNLTQVEYEYCNKHIKEIKELASRVYKWGKNEELRKRYNLLDCWKNLQRLL